MCYSRVFVSRSPYVAMTNLFLLRAGFFHSQRPTSQLIAYKRLKSIEGNEPVFGVA